MQATLLLAQNSDAASVVMLVIQLAVIIVTFVGLWLTYEKAGQPGWATLIPIYNLYILLKIAGKSGWWVLLFFIPLVNLVVSIIVYLDLAKRFNRGAGFGIGLLFLPFIFFPILGLGDDRYQGTALATA